MNKTAVLSILLAVCLVVLAVCAFLIFGNGFRLNYANASEYTAGEAALTDAPANLDIDWIDGSVDIRFHAEPTVLIAETSTKNIPEDLALRWWMDGSTLRIRYAKAGVALWNQNLNKRLTLTLPEGTVLGDVAVHGTSSDVSIAQMQADSLALETTSGDIRAEAAAVRLTASSTSGSIQGTIAGAVSVTATATSGGIGLTLTGDAESVNLSSTSGNVSLHLDEADAVTISTTSGGISLEALSADRVQTSSTSGSVTLGLGAFGDLEVGTTSGSVAARLPQLPGFSGEITTTSGAIRTGLPLTKDGSKWSCGDGSARISIHTTSGSVQLD